jgi:hypothetical protein
MRGDRLAAGPLNDAVRIRSLDGSLVRVKVWKRDGTAVYSDDHAAIGAKFPLHSDVAQTIDQQSSTVDMSDLTDPENATEAGPARAFRRCTPSRTWPNAGSRSCRALGCPGPRRR